MGVVKGNYYKAVYGFRNPPLAMDEGENHTSDEEYGSEKASPPPSMDQHPILPSLDELAPGYPEPESDEDDVPAVDSTTGGEVVIGIDLGTTFSCVAVWEGGRPVVIANNQGNRTTPSWVYFEQDEVFVGEAARTKAARQPKLAVYDAKRMIGRKLTDPGIQQSRPLWPFAMTEFRGNCAVELIPDAKGGKPRLLMPEEVSAYVLAKMRHTAEDYLGRPARRAVVTVPAYFNDAQRQATIDASTIAGLKVERIINEPTAAAVAYGLEKGPSSSDKPQTLLVYDLGGGTLDVTILVLEGGTFEVKSTNGDTQLGGQDFDNKMVEYFLPRVEAKCGEDISNNARAMKKLRDACQKLKHELSHSDEAVLEVDALVNGEDFDCPLTREKFVEICSDLLARCLEPLDRALSDAGITANQVDEIVLVGGSTRIVRVQELLEGYFPNRKLSKKINPDEAVAMGAAIQGANLASGYEQKDARLSGITLMDVAPLSMGIELANGKMSVLIKRNTTIPYSHTKVYKNNEDYQTEAVIEVFEGEEKYAKNNRLLGRFVLPGLPPRPRGSVQIPVTFTVDANGVLEVVASVSGEEGTTKKVVIQKDKGLLSEAEIQQKAKVLAKWEQKCRTLKLS